MVEVRRLGHATLTTPDIGGQVAYYTEIIGLVLVDRSAKGAVLASKQGLEAIALEPGPANALSRLAFQVAPGSDLAALARGFSRRGSRPSGAAASRLGSMTLLSSRIRKAR